MKSLIIADVSPLLASDAAYGGSRWRDLFVSAIRSISDEIEAAITRARMGVRPWIRWRCMRQCCLMVSTQIGAEGLHFAAEQETLLRDEDAGSARAGVQLLRSDDLCTRLGAVARVKTQDWYGAAEAIARIAEIVQRGRLPNRGW